MKKYKSIIFAAIAVLAASCVQHRTCPTYTKHIKHVKADTEKI